MRAGQIVWRGSAVFSSFVAVRQSFTSLSSAETRIPSPVAAVSRFSSYSSISSDASSPMTGMSVGGFGFRPFLARECALDSGLNFRAHLPIHSFSSPFAEVHW
jgi:hypothetical protein